MSENGLLVVSDALHDTEEKESYPYPLPLEELEELAEAEPRPRALLAPFWADAGWDALRSKVKGSHFMYFTPASGITQLS